MVFNQMTSASANLMMVDISTNTHSISCKPIIPNRKLYTMKMMRKKAATTAAIMMMKATAKKRMTLLNRQKRNKRLGVAWTVVLIVIRKN